MRQARRSRILARFAQRKSHPDFYISYVRTRQTAGILAEECFAEEIHTADELLQPNWQMVRNHILQEGSPIALVSHHPFLQAYLLTTCSAAVKFDLAGIAVID